MCAALALLCAWRPAPLHAADYEAQIFTNATGQTLPYRLLTPPDEGATAPRPLVIFFHGAGERGNDNQAQLVHGTRFYLQPEVRSQFPCYVLAPQCPEGQQWVDMPWGDDVGKRPAQPSASMTLALQVLDSVIKTHKVDTNRIYVTGLSMGGYATWDCITRFPNRFAAGAPICGGGDETTVSATVAKVPVWAFHSDDDGAVKVIRTRHMIEAFRKAGGTPKYFEYFGLGHNAWTTAYAEPEFLPWMFSQRLGKPDTFVLKTPAPALPAVAQWPAQDDLFPGKGPLQKADWFQQLWKSRRLMWHRSLQQDQGAVVFLGDSITHGWGSLEKDFAGLKVVNRGIGGDVTRGIRFRLKEDVLDVHPAAVVILIGTNDLGLGGNPEDAAANIEAILHDLRAANPRMPIILCKVMPRAIEPGRFPEKIQALNRSLETMAAKDARISLCDTWSIFANEQGGAKKDEFPDLLHPNAIGYGKWTAALKPLLAKQGVLK